MQLHSFKITTGIFALSICIQISLVNDVFARQFAHVSERDEGIWGKGELDSDEEKRSED